jgi:hypothetical protein
VRQSVEILEDTIFGPAPLYYMRGLGMGPWVWNVWIYLLYMRVDATSFRSLFLFISTLVVGESWRLGPLPIWRYIYRWCLGRESWEDLWLTRDVDHCWAGIINCTNPCWVSWRFWRFIITISQKYQIPTFYCIDEEDYNNLFHMSKKTMWKCQIKKFHKALCPQKHFYVI